MRGLAFHLASFLIGWSAHHIVVEHSSFRITDGATNAEAFNGTWQEILHDQCTVWQALRVAAEAIHDAVAFRWSAASR